MAKKESFGLKVKKFFIGSFLVSIFYGAGFVLQEVIGGIPFPAIAGLIIGMLVAYGVTKNIN